MNSTAIFSDRAQEYARYRPSHSEDAIAVILDGLASYSQLFAADIGAGTGIASRQLGDRLNSMASPRGIKVIAVEPNKAMVQAAEAHPLVEFKLGTAENTTLADNSVDLVTSFQAFHWFDPLPTLQEFYRILKPNGRLALIWSMWDESDTFTYELSKLVTNASDTTSKHQNWEYKVGSPPENSYFYSFNRFEFSYTEQRNLRDLIGLVESQGFISLSGTKHEQLINNLKELHQEWVGDRGSVSLAYRTEVYISQAQTK